MGAEQVLSRRWPGSWSWELGAGCCESWQLLAAGGVRCRFLLRPATQAACLAESGEYCVAERSKRSSVRCPLLSVCQSRSEDSSCLVTSCDVFVLWWSLRTGERNRCGEKEYCNHTCCLEGLWAEFAGCLEHHVHSRSKEGCGFLKKDEEQKTKDRSSCKYCRTCVPHCSLHNATG